MEYVEVAPGRVGKRAVRIVADNRGPQKPERAAWAKVARLLGIGDA